MKPRAENRRLNLEFNWQQRVEGLALSTLFDGLWLLILIDGQLVSKKIKQWELSSFSAGCLKNAATFDFEMQ